MAGESPGKPEQKQSSGETAGSERDPRLAVFRETPAGEAKADEAGKADKSGTPGKADKGDKAAGEADRADTAAAAGEAGAQGEGRDERLREAVAAWVATKDDDGAEGGSGGETGAGADAEKETRAKAEAGDAPVTKASADAGVGAGAGDGDAAGSGAAAEGAAKGSADKSAKEPVKTSAKEPAKGKGAAGEPAEGSAKDAPKGAPKDAPKDAGKAAPAGDAKDAGPKAAAEGSAAGSAAKGSTAKGSAARGSAAKGSDVKGSAAKEEGASGAASEGASASVDQPTAIFKAPSLAEGGEAPADEATRVFSIAKQKGSGDADAAKADTGSGARDSAKGGAKNGVTGGRPDAETAAPKPEKSAEGSAEKSAEKDDRKTPEKADEKPAEKAAEKAAGKSGAKTQAASGAKSGTKTEGKTEGKTEAKTEGKPNAGSASPVDQPTTAIKAVRPPGAAESDGERTSQFVALKSTDPQPIKSPRPVGGDKSGKTGKSGKQAAKDAAKTDDKPGTKPGTKPAAEPDVAPGTKWGAKAAATSGAATGTQPEAKSGAAEASATAAPAGTAAKSGATAQPGALPDSEQTRQQPLPPLDLLAQLTNTPPPPETPMRTIARRFKIWTPLVLLLLVVFVVVQQVRPLPSPTLALNGKTSFTFEGGSFQMPWPKEGQAVAKVVGAGSLGTYGDEKPVPTASVAKIMTAYVILKNHPLKVKEEGPKITIDAKAVQEGNAPGESTIPGLKEGQQYSEAKMLQMLMIHSANNVARALARWDAGSEQEFAKKMNAAAKDLGMKNTTYTDPSGLNKTTVSTAVDQLKLAEEVMKVDAFRPIVAMPDAKDGLPTRIFNANDLIARHPELSVKGIKTGSSTAAGGALVWASYKGVGGKDQLILGVTMAQHAKGPDTNGTSSLALVLARSKPMIEAVRNALTSATTVKKGQVVGYVDDGVGGETPVVATKDLQAIGVPGQKIDFKIGAAAGKSVPQEAKAGTVVGELTVGTGSSAAKVPVALQKDLAEPSFGAKLMRIA